MNLTDRPLAATGLTSYRCKGRYGWIMIGAKDHNDAMREALLSCETAKREDLQVWNGTEYVTATAKERLYHILAIVDAKGYRERMTACPMTHAECMTMISKQSNHLNAKIGRRFMVEEAT